MTQAFAHILADSISPEGIRITTFHLRYWRPIHAECRTHRVIRQSAEQIEIHTAEISLMDDDNFSRNAGSSRARPSKAIIEQVRNAPWGPIHWGSNKPGMQAGAELTGDELLAAQDVWKNAAIAAANNAADMLDLGVHKQIVNRLLEPFTYIDVVLTATDFANWFELRDHHMAQPEIQQLAQLMKAAMAESTPELLQPGEWHLPYVDDQAWQEAHAHLKVGRVTRDEPPYWEKANLLCKVSAARCARVSYKPFDEDSPSIEADLGLFERLFGSSPMHASPAEHQATPDTTSSYDHYRMTNAGRDITSGVEYDNQHEHGNLRGWRQYRKMLPGEFVPG